MIATLIGKDKFREGMDKYFELFDGQAVTTEDFIQAMELASGRDLTQFKNWYSRPGTPTLKINGKNQGDQFILEIEQHYPPTTLKVPAGNVLHMPFKVSLYSDAGNMEETTLELTKLKESFSFPINGKVIPSLNRGFSAPVIVDYTYEFSDLLKLMKLDNDPYCKYEATQRVYDSVFKEDFSYYKTHGKLNGELRQDFKDAFEGLLKDSSLDLSFKSYLLELPTENSIAQEMAQPDFEAIHLVHTHLHSKLALVFHDWFLAEHKRLSSARKFELTPVAFGERALKNQCLTYLVASNSEASKLALKDHFFKATNMTEEIHALGLYVKLGVPLEHEAIQTFYNNWKADSLVMLKWFATLAANTPKHEAIKRLHILENDPLFEKQVPNFLRSLYIGFTRNNLDAFHAQDGSGYEFIADRIMVMDKFNPQVASRAASNFSMINRLDDARKEAMRKSLGRIMSGKPSRDTFEVISKYLAQ